MSERFPRMLDRTDREFWQAHDRLRKRLTRQATPAEIEPAAETLVQCLKEMKGDPLAWDIALAIYSEFVAAGEAPPMPILAALSEVFDRIRGGMDWADAIRGHKAGKGRPAISTNIGQRMAARTNAGIVEDLIERGLTEREAIKKAARMLGAPRKKGMPFAVSEGAVKRDFRRWKKR